MFINTHPFFTKNIRFILIFLILWSTSCKQEKPSSGLTIKRYENALFAMDKDKIPEELPKLQKDFGVFFEGTDLLDEKTVLQLKNFITDPFLIEIYRTVEERYPDLSALEKELTHAFDLYNEQMHQKKSYPKTYSYVSGLDFQNRVIYQDSFLLIALDMYLGKDSKFYASIQLPKYMTSRFELPYVAIDVMRAVGNLCLINQLELNTLLDHIIYQGKMMYFLSRVLPEKELFMLAGYTKAQWEWCEYHEKEVWSYWIQNNLLFEKDYFKIKNFINDGATSAVFPGSPARITAYIGYRMVKKYMNNAPLNMLEIMTQKGHNNQEILKSSGYKG